MSKSKTSCEDEYDILVSDYSEKSLKVEGEATKSFIPEWKSVGGRFNKNLKGGPGWIFPKKREEELLKVIESIKNEDIEASDPVKSSLRGLVDKISRDMKNLSTEDRQEVREYIKSSFYLE